MGKTALILAPIIVGGLFLFLAFWLGRWFERAGQRYAASFISPQLYQRLVQFVGCTLNPTDLDAVPYLPPALKDEATELLELADKQASARSRHELRRRGF